MDLGLENKPVLVMASTSGIGYAVALEFAREKAKVMLFGRSEKKLQEARSKIFSITHNPVEYIVGDMTKKRDIEHAVKETAGTFGTIYALFNNTGGPQPGKFEDLDDTNWKDAFELTLLSYIRSVRAVLPIMRKAGKGRIVNNTSSSIKSAIDNLILSNTFRTGIMGLTKTLSRELGPENILVNVIGAGKIATERVRYLDSVIALQEGVSPEEYRRKFEEGIPLKRYGDPAEIAKMVVFLCSEANTYITGQSVLVDGGMIQAY